MTPNVVHQEVVDDAKVQLLSNGKVRLKKTKPSGTVHVTIIGEEVGNTISTFMGREAVESTVTREVVCPACNSVQEVQDSTRLYSCGCCYHRLVITGDDQ